MSAAVFILAALVFGLIVTVAYLWRMVTALSTVVLDIYKRVPR